MRNKRFFIVLAGALIFGLLAVGYLLWVGVSGRNAHVLSAVTLIVALLAQAEWGDIGWWNRYELYLIMFGTLVLCRMANEVTVTATHRPALLVFLLAFTAVPTGRLGPSIATPLALSNTYRQRYQIGTFYETEYQGQPVATGELGDASPFTMAPSSICSDSAPTTSRSRCASTVDRYRPGPSRTSWRSTASRPSRSTRRRSVFRGRRLGCGTLGGGCFARTTLLGSRTPWTSTHPMTEAVTSSNADSARIHTTCHHE